MWLFVLLHHFYLFIKFCASPSNLWGSVSTVIGCSITSWFLIMMQFHVDKNSKGTYHTAVARMQRKKCSTRSHRLTSKRPHTRTHTWKHVAQRHTNAGFRKICLSVCSTLMTMFTVIPSLLLVFLESVLVL